MRAFHNLVPAGFNPDSALLNPGGIHYTGLVCLVFGARKQLRQLIPKRLVFLSPPIAVNENIV